MNRSMEEICMQGWLTGDQIQKPLNENSASHDTCRATAILLEWIHLAQDIVLYQALWNMVMNVFLFQLSIY
jgi:hypothetical protein